MHIATQKRDLSASVEMTGLGGGKVRFLRFGRNDGGLGLEGGVGDRWLGLGLDDGVWWRKDQISPLWSK